MTGAVMSAAASVSDPSMLAEPIVLEVENPTRHDISLSIVIPTYNESATIQTVLESITATLPKELATEIIVVDDSSPDGTGGMVSRYSQDIDGNGLSQKIRVRLISRPTKSGLSSAILAGMKAAYGELVVVMDSDLSHPPEVIPKMIQEIKNSKCDIVLASRYVRGGSILGWPFKRRIISRGATAIAQILLRVKEHDPMSGFFLLRRSILEGIEFDAIGYKLLLELLVKTRGTIIKEIPYCFSNRNAGDSKLDNVVMIDYLKAVWRLYRHGQKQNWTTIVTAEKRASVKFASKAARFYTVGATGLLLNYLVSMALANVWSDVSYMYSSVVGILASMTSNFIFNKFWTFGDKDTHLKKLLSQYGLFMSFSSLGAGVQLGMIYALNEIYRMDYPIALILAVATAAIGNFVFNKKWTFKQKVWS